MKKSSLLILFAALFLIAECSYDWDYNYPEIDMLTGWPIYQVQNGDTLGQIAERKYGSEELWTLLKLRNKSLKNEPQDSLLDSSLKILIPPIEECAQIMDESCVTRFLVEEEEATSQNDGGSMDNHDSHNRRFLEIRLDSSELQSELLKATKRSYSYFNNLLSTDTLDVNLILENHSTKTISSWGTPNASLAYNLPWKVRPGDKEFLSFRFNETNSSLKRQSCMFYAKVEGEAFKFLKIYVSMQFSQLKNQWESEVNVVYTDNSEYEAGDTYDSLSPNSWSNSIQADENVSFPLNLNYYLSQGLPIVGMFLFQDRQNLFTPSDSWIIQSGTNPLEQSSDKWQIEMANSLTQEFTISQGGMHLGRVGNSVRLTLSDTETPTELENFKITKCSADQYEISQDQKVLSYDSTLSSWIFTETTSPCLKSLSIKRNI